MGDVLDNDLFLLLLGAVLTLLGAYLARRWQEHQKGLELKDELAGDLSESIVRIVKAVQHYREHDQESDSRDDLKSEAREWEIKRAILGAKLEAYFPGTGISCDWRKYQEVMCFFYTFELENKDIEESDDRKELLREWKSVGTLRLRGWNDTYNAIMLVKSDFIRRVLQTPIQPLRSSWWSNQRLERKWRKAETLSQKTCDDDIRQELERLNNVPAGHRGLAPQH